MMPNPQTIPSDPADAASPASAMMVTVAIFSPAPVFAIENRNRFHNSPLLPYSSFIAPPLLANTRLAFSVKVIGHWPSSGCRWRAFVVGTGNQRARQPKQQSKPNDVCSKNSSFRWSGNDLPGNHRDRGLHRPVSGTHVTAKIGGGLRDFCGFRTICPGFAHYSLTPAHRLALKSGWIV